MRTHILCSALSALILASTPGSAQTTGQAGRTIRADAPPTTDTRQLICRGAPVPSGWAVTDDIRDRQMCGGDNPVTLNLYNVWVIERLDSRPVGTVVEVCAGAPTPAGWVLVDVYRAKDKCGHPDEMFFANIKRIRRTQ